ncbi:MAG: pyruvate, phosphate dikinase [Chloroflexota bacterium]
MPHVFAYDHDHGLPLPELALKIGGKAANIATMAVDLGLPVPPAFTVSTAACNAYLASGWPDGLDAELRAQMARMEGLVGRRFGDASDPLLVSVRSGAPRSMPGMMDTILNLGLNDATEAGLAATAGDPAFAADCHARFVKIYRDIVGVETVPEDPWDQLRGAVEAVFRSWNSDRAKAYREKEGIPEDLGTGVTVQAMVFGNRGLDSGTGVLFTRNPATGENVFYGDVMFNAQGEDVVAGTHATEPVSCLDARMPEVAAELRRYATTLEHHYRDCCDIEFTIERGRLWMLQVRVGKRTPQAAQRMDLEMAEDPTFPLTRAEAIERVRTLLSNPPTTVTERSDAGPVLATGLPASPGVACGQIQLTPEDAVAAADGGARVILVRSETSPDDVHGMSRAAGILTSTGGFASHAAVVARGWGIPAVVGASAVIIGADGVTIGGTAFRRGDTITIDGATGDVFAGVAAGTTEVVPEAAVLLGWARELGIEVSEPEGLGDIVDSPCAEPPESVAPVGITAGDVLRVLVVKGYAGPDGVATALGCAREDATGTMDAMIADGLVEPGAGSFRLTADGKAVGMERIAQDTAAWGIDNAVGSLDAFLALDHRMKTIVTTWQMKGGVFNDHADAAYDAAVLASLGELHLDVEAWLAPLTAGLPRLARYGVRLAAAAAAAAGGNGKFLASPRVDSYHGAWFELHEDLILLAGRNRADEVAAGRA